MDLESTRTGIGGTYAGISACGACAQWVAPVDAGNGGYHGFSWTLHGRNKTYKPLVQALLDT
jgi:hypothetical protein